MKKILILLVFITAFNLNPMIPYQGRFKSLITKRFKIIYPESHTEMAEKTAVYAEDIFDKVEGFMKWKPFRRITVIITDQTDQANGLAMSHFRNTITLYTPSVENIESLRDTNDPLYSLILHELTHILQLDQIRGAAYFWRVVTGRLYFPNSGAFLWFHEGAAVYAESRLTEGGRLDTAYTKAMIDELASRRAIPDFHRIVHPVVDWPFGQSHYHLGAIFTEYLINTYGHDKYLAFNHDLSNDFWPFIYEFMLKFRKIYGKSLNDLWNEWREFEYSKIPEKEKELEIFHNSGGVITFAGINNGIFYYSDYNKDKGAGLYRIDENGRHKRVVSGLYENAAFTERGLLYVENTVSPGLFSYNDIYFLPENRKTAKRLTFHERAGALSYCQKSSQGVYIRGNEFVIFNMAENRLNTRKVIKQELFKTIIDIDIINNKAVFSGRLNTEANYSIGILDIESGLVEAVSGITGKKPFFIDDESIVFTGKKADLYDKPYTFNLKSMMLEELETSSGYVRESFIYGDNLYSIGLYNGGEAVFKDRIVSVNTSDNEEPVWLSNDPIVIDNPSDFRKTFYNPFAYLEPLYWYPLPVILDRTFIIPLTDKLYIPMSYIAPGFFFAGFEPLNRFAYQTQISLDYLRWYPHVNLNLSFKVPCMNIEYYFHTRKFDSVYDYYPILLENGLSLIPYFHIDNNNMISLNTTFHISFFQTGFDGRNFKETFVFYSGINYSFYKQFYRGAFSFDAGFLSLGYGDLENKLRGVTNELVLSTSIPLGKHTYYIDTKAGLDLFMNNSFRVGSYSLAFNTVNSLSLNGGTVDFKGISFQFSEANPQGFAYIYTGSGFKFELYRRTHYWQFLTLGFKGMYIKPFAEIIAVFVNDYDKREELYGDIGLDFAVDFFAYYGNVAIKLNQGYSLGYDFYRNKPLFNIYLYLSTAL